MAKSNFNEKLILKNVRGSYVYIDKPNPNGKPEKPYSMQIIIKKDHPQIKELKKAIKKVFNTAFGEDAKKAKYKLPLRDGNEERDEPHYQDCYFINLTNKAVKPGILNRRKKQASEHDIEEYCYSGAYFHVAINIYDYPAQEGGKAGIGVGLNNVMLYKHGESLGGGSSNAEDDFGDIEVEDDDGFEDDDIDDLDDF